MIFLSNMNNLSDLNYAFTTSRQCMKLLGIWPDPNVPLNVFRRPKIEFMLATCIMSVYVFTPQVINTIRAWGNISRVVELFVTANFSMMAICKMIITRYHGESKLLFCNKKISNRFVFIISKV